MKIQQQTPKNNLEWAKSLGRRSVFLSEGAAQIGCGPIWAWSLKLMLVLLRS